VRILTVEPGPQFSVLDVHRGWTAGLAEAGADVVSLNLADRLNFYAAALIEKDGNVEKALGDDDAIQLAVKGVEVACYEYWPDAVVVTSGFYLDPSVYRLIRARGHKIVVVCTESPYEDDRQYPVADLADVVVLNDPTNLDAFRHVNPHTYYVPHAYDPAVHHRRESEPDLVSDFCFVGTGYPSRVEFFEQIDWKGVDAAFAGNWQDLADDSPLRPFVAHDIADCIDNADAARLYSSTKLSANLYRREANRPELSAGWAMGPREVELAALGVAFLRDPRGEGDELLPMLPTFDGPDDFADKLRWWLSHDRERDEAALKAQAAVADRTFANHAAQLLRLLERL
jgi:spore maturation protein CgeB